MGSLKQATWFRTSHRLLYKCLQRLMMLDVTHLMCLDRERARHPEGTPTNFEFRFLTADEVRSFAQPSNELTPEMGQRVAGGRDDCFAALCGDRLAGYIWYASGSIEAEHNRGGDRNSGVAMSFPKQMAFMYKGFVHPDFRGSGLYGSLNALGLERLHLRGVETVVSTADWTNWSALRCCWRLGYEDLGLVWRGGRSPLEFTLAPRQGRSLGIRFGRQAQVVLRS